MVQNYDTLNQTVKRKKVDRPPTTPLPNQEQMRSNTATRWWKYLCRVASLEYHSHYLRETIFNRYRIELSITIMFELDTWIPAFWNLWEVGSGVWRSSVG